MKRILFVDDESKILDGIRRMLRANRERWDMQFAVGGEAALQACEATSFDVVVSDMRMPGMDGSTLLGHIRDRYPSAARIILSGYSDAAASTRAVSVAHRFISKPCNGPELQEAIERVCTLQEILRAPEIRKVVGAVGELPSLSTTYLSLTRAVSDPNTPMSQIVRIVEQDVAMSAKVLQLVNSAFFGLAQSVTSLQSAVSHLGMKTIENLALATETFRVFTPSSRIPDSVCESLQQHAHRTAAIAGALPVDRKSRDVAVVAALLHDVGRLILASKMPDLFCTLSARANERHCELFEAEEEMIGVSHAEIGAYLLGLWGISNLAVEAIAHHHHPTRISHSGFDISVTVYVADLLDRELETHPNDSTGSELKDSDRTCLQTLGIFPRFAEFRDLAKESAN